MKYEAGDMRKIFLLIAILFLMGTQPSWAATSFETAHNGGEVTLDDNGIVAGVIFDAPKLIGLTKNLDLGVEATKTLMVNPFDGETRSWVDSNDNYTVMAKVTYTGCFFRCGLK